MAGVKFFGPSQSWVTLQPEAGPSPPSMGSNRCAVKQAHRRAQGLFPGSAVKTKIPKTNSLLAIKLSSSPGASESPTRVTSPSSTAERAGARRRRRPSRSHVFPAQQEERRTAQRELVPHSTSRSSSRSTRHRSAHDKDSPVMRDTLLDRLARRRSPQYILGRDRSPSSIDPTWK